MASSAVKRAILGLLLALAMQLGRCQDSAKPKCGIVSKKCEFPFDYNDYNKRSCIEFDEGDGLYCKQLQGEGKGRFASWSWGLCNQACLSDEGHPKECSAGDSGSSDCEDCKNEQVDCKFPFTYQDGEGNVKEYNGCTDIDTPDGRKWCATKVDDDGWILKDSNNETYFWGTCDMAKCHEIETVVPSSGLKGQRMVLDPLSLAFFAAFSRLFI